MNKAVFMYLLIVVSAFVMSGEATAEEADERESAFHDLNIGTEPEGSFLHYFSDYGSMTFAGYGASFGMSYRDLIRGEIYAGGVWLNGSVVQLPGGPEGTIDITTSHSAALGLELGLTPVRIGGFEMQLRGRVAFPVAGMDTIVSWDFEYEVPQVIEDYASEYSDDLLENSLPGRIDWVCTELSLTLGGVIGRFHLYLELSYMNLHLSISPDIEAMGAVGEYVRPSVSSTLHLPWYWIGMDVNLPYAMALSVKAMAVPADDYGTLIAGHLTFTAPLNPISGDD